MEAKKLSNLTIEDYLAIQIEQDQKYEYHDGAIFAMAGGTIQHAMLGANALVVIGSSIERSDLNCFTLNSDARLHILKPNVITYPDAMVVCGSPIYSQQDRTAIVNPTIVIEVLSPSTETYDRGDKLFFYKQIPTLKEYLLIAQDKRQVDVFRRNDDSRWTIQRFTELSGQVEIESLGINLELERLYRRVDG